MALKIGLSQGTVYDEETGRIVSGLLDNQDPDIKWWEWDEDALDEDGRPVPAFTIGSGRKCASTIVNETGHLSRQAVTIFPANGGYLVQVRNAGGARIIQKDKPHMSLAAKLETEDGEVVDAAEQVTVVQDGMIIELSLADNRYRAHYLHVVIRAPEIQVPVVVERGTADESKGLAANKFSAADRELFAALLPWRIIAHPNQHNHPTDLGHAVLALRDHGDQYWVNGRNRETYSVSNLNDMLRTTFYDRVVREEEAAQVMLDRRLETFVADARRRVGQGALVAGIDAWFLQSTIRDWCVRDGATVDLTRKMVDTVEIAIRAGIRA